MSTSNNNMSLKTSDTHQQTGLGQFNKAMTRWTTVSNFDFKLDRKTTYSGRKWLELVCFRP